VVPLHACGHGEAGRRESVGHAVEVHRRGDGDLHVDDVLRREPRNGRRADVVDGHHLVADDRTERVRHGRELGRPGRVGRDDQDLAAHACRASWRRYPPSVTVVPNAVSSARFGQLASILPDCASTQDIVRAAAGQNAPEGFLVVADHQTAGRGRLGRTWFSAPGQSLLLSLLLRPATAPERLPPLSLVAGLAVAEALPVDARVRWPNDVVVGGAKWPGSWRRWTLDPTARAVVFLGVGINVNVPAHDLPETDRLPATSLLVELGAPGRPHVAARSGVVDRFQAAYREFEALGFGPCSTATARSTRWSAPR
jgi:biotin-[acetyl-CoA-carboxylase] ligase BirA-like protein